MLGSTNCTDSAWLGFHENDLAARIDLGQPTPIKELGASFLQNVSLGIYLPTKVEFLAGDNPAALRPVGTTTSPSGGQAGPFKQSLRLEGLDLRARYLEVRASNTRVIPAGHPAAGQKAWLFVDEVMVNPAAVRP